MVDFSRPGNDGFLLPDGFIPWQWCVVYTVRPELLSPLRSRNEYTIIARMVRRQSLSERFSGYGRLYKQAAALANMRITQLTCNDTRDVQHARILTHGWSSDDRTHISSAWAGFGVVALKTTDARP